MKRKTAAITVLTIVSTGILTALPAFAEGSWSGSMTSVTTGFESRRWSDMDSDTAATTIKLYNCRNYLGSGTNVNAYLELFKDRFGPDPSVGTKTFTNCGTSAGSTQSWGRGTQDDYYFVFQGSNSGNASFSSSVTVKY
ncbi:hypothetical protein ACQP1K_25225 [Sphaerimonospora sp. CA-214678]|uniref:hypothetical protein n=1 Tax=Sphaerimonospora sp. CA-214678 TaxID=3240029 RepID=UPI003D8AEF75